MMTELLRIEAGHFVAALDVEDGVVVRTAPILAYMKGWTEAGVQSYARRKGWKVVSSATDTPRFKCPRCGWVSYNPHDIEEGYCGRCHAFTADRAEDGEDDPHDDRVFLGASCHPGASLRAWITSDGIVTIACRLCGAPILLLPPNEATKKLYAQGLRVSDPEVPDGPD